MTEVGMENLAVSAGYKNCRSDAILAAVKLLQSEGKMIKKKNSCSLIEQGIKERVPDEEVAANPEEAMERFWTQLKMKLEWAKKTKGAKALENARAMCDLLQDGKVHNYDEFFDVTSYNMERSTGFQETLTAMKELGFIEKEKKKAEFTDKVFPVGCP